MSKKLNLAIHQTLANTESGIYEKVESILASGGTLEEVEKYCKLLEHSVKTVRTHMDQDRQIENIGDDINCANFATENSEYNACVGALLICLKLVPNPMQRDDLRLRYYRDILSPDANVDYETMLASLQSMVIKLNGGKPYAPPVPKEVKESLWKKFLPTFSVN